ncbi:carbon-nitrogen hydrolase family protein [Blastopirellula sp. JC732]|uniref:Carbon-nitrogen hydrolase family protein n=1 Tax=Blastopirellula sediminis TaxID=2894196 RepID=A0A9X1SGR5_9BACT|nr:carbon-nitrogen hydrolase family protein [Blastopirellula sediminis]MCC9607445.1 carbon-nitrogen hydrolase family protein [Blastopirellula sediminis]MCC9629262.1 carbon-nitrogen hydrolase family protein [Blastopirellula sediminis]
MTDPWVAAAVQMNAGEDKEANLQTAERLIAEAADKGAQLVVLPELFNFLGRLEELAEQAEPLDGITATRMREAAQKHQIFLVAGSFAERREADDRVYNTSLFFDPKGSQIGLYRKIHLFDVELPDVHVQESKFVAPGELSSTVETELGGVAQAICYDLRFPELPRSLELEKVACLALPAAFTAKTGAAHWQVLIRARAIENQLFVIAANQFGQYVSGIQSYGHSLIVDPWGTVLAAASGDAEAVITAEISLAKLREVRQHMPTLHHRRLQK